MQLLEGYTTVERTLFHQASKKKIPINGSIELLPLCNMNCDMCYVRLSKEEMDKKGRLRSAEEWLEVAKQMQKAGTLFLLLTGGEPFLYPEFESLYLELQKMGMILTINTNGTLIDEKWAAFLGQHKPRRVNITLYGADEETYAALCHYPGGFDKTINAIKLLRQHGVDVRISFSVTKANAKDVEKIFEIGEYLGVPVLVDTYMMPAEREREESFCLQSRAMPREAAKIRMCAMKRKMGEENLLKYREHMQEEMKNVLEGKTYSNKSSCYAGKSSYTINWQGEIRPCVIMSEPSMSVFDYGFENAWKYIVEEVEKLEMNAKCSTCKFRSLCRTCVASAMLETGDYQGIPKYMCEYAEESVRILFEE